MEIEHRFQSSTSVIYISHLHRGFDMSILLGVIFQVALPFVDVTPCQDTGLQSCRSCRSGVSGGGDVLGVGGVKPSQTFSHW